MKPMINPYKYRPLARLCTLALRTFGPGSPTEVGQGKEEDFNGGSTGGLWGRKPMDEQSHDIEKVSRRETGPCSGCSGT